MTYGPVFLPVRVTSIPDIAVAACKSGSEFMHTAIAFRGDDSRMHLLDLRIDGVVHCSLLPDDNKYAWAIPPIDPSLRESVRRVCAALAHSPPDLYYGLKYAPSQFKAEGASITVTLGGDTLGFTCATFVLAVFDTLGLSLVRHETWPVRESDSEQQRSIAQWAKDSVPSDRPFGIAKDVMDRNAADIPCVRYRCEEVLASSAAKTRPVDFENAERNGRKVKRWIFAAAARRSGQEPE